MMRRTPIAIVAVALALAFVPSLGLPAFYDSLLYLVLHWIVLATSWNILSGYTGYFSFGHGAFFGAGIYTSATLMSRYDWPFLWTLPAGGAGGQRAGPAGGRHRVPREGHPRRSLRAADAGGDLRRRHRHRQHADRRRQWRVAGRGGHPQARPHAVGHLLPAGAGHRGGHAAGGLGHLGVQAGRGAVRDPRRRGRGRGDGRAHLPLQAAGAGHVVRAGRCGRRHPRALSQLRDGGRDSSPSPCH
jgi:hypothetical protein